MSKIEDLIVVKYGSTSVTNEDGMDIARVARHVDQLAAIAEKRRLIVVSSGSVVTGRAIWQARHPDKEVDDQTLAMLGTAGSFDIWRREFAKHGILAGQLLVTHHVIDDPSEGSTLKKALTNSIEAGMVPIINENDALSEIELAELSYDGDNDGLARHIAMAMHARELLLLTGRAGLLNADNQVVTKVTNRNLAYARSLAHESDGGGRGGMKSKLKAAVEASRAGAVSHIAHADADLEQVMAGLVGTTVDMT